MEVLTSAWVVIVIYCTQWFGFNQCVAVPVPTLLNYYHGSDKANWNFGFRQLRNPAIYYDKFVFPSKDSYPRLGDRSKKLRDNIQENSGKIYFPDEAQPESTEKTSTNSDVIEAMPGLNSHHRPITETADRSSKWKQYDEYNLNPSADGSFSKATQQLPKVYENVNQSRNKMPLQMQTSEEIRVAEALQEYYEWLKTSKIAKKLKFPAKPQSGNSDSAPLQNLHQVDDDDDQESSTKQPFISDQSLVAGLKNQKCPDGQIRLENGECKSKVEV